MRRTLPFFFLSLLASACLVPPRQGAQAEPYKTPPESQAQIRDSEAKAYEASDSATDQQLDDLEKDVGKALKMALGKEGAAAGAPTPAPAAATIAELQKAKVKLRIEQVQDQNGNAVNQDFLQLKDSLTDRIQVLAKKMGEKKATPAETKEIQEGVKHVAKINDLKMQVMNASMAMMKANNHAQTGSLQTMLRVSQLVRTRKLHEMEISKDDIALVKRGLERQRRAEALAAVSMGMVAAYQGVANGNKDPKAVQLMAEKTLEAFPIKPTVTDDEAKSYMSGLKGNVSKVKGKYEAMLRKVHGDAKYEREYKSGIDAMFKQAETAEEQKSVGKIAQEHQAEYDKTHPGGPELPDASGPFGKSLEGMQALAKGDPKAALNAAMDFVPVPGLKQGLGLILSLI